MTALVEPKTLVNPGAVLVTSTRGAPLAVQRRQLQLFAAHLGLTVIREHAFRRRRRGRPGEQLCSVLPEGTSVVVVVSLSALAKDPLEALGAAAEIRSTGVTLASVEEDWLLEMGSVLPALGGWLATARRAQRAEQARAALGRARADGRRIGRPRAGIDMAAAFSLLTEVGSVERVAARLSVGESTLRRAIRAAACPPSMSSTSSTSSSGLGLGGVH